MSDRIRPTITIDEEYYRELLANQKTPANPVQAATMIKEVISALRNFPGDKTMFPHEMADFLSQQITRGL